MRKPRTREEWRTYLQAVSAYKASRETIIAGQQVNLDEEAPVIPFHSFGVSPPIPPSDIPVYAPESFGVWCDDTSEQ